MQTQPLLTSCPKVPVLAFSPSLAVQNFIFQKAELPLPVHGPRVFWRRSVFLHITGRRTPPRVLFSLPFFLLIFWDRQTCLFPTVSNTEASPITPHAFGLAWIFLFSFARLQTPTIVNCPPRAESFDGRYSLNTLGQYPFFHFGFSFPLQWRFPIHVPAFGCVGALFLKLFSAYPQSYVPFRFATVTAGSLRQAWTVLPWNFLALERFIYSVPQEKSP